MSVRISRRIPCVILVFAAAVATVRPCRADAPSDPPPPQLPPSQWQLKQGAPHGVAELLDRAKRQRELDFANQVRAVGLAREDVEARKAGRVVRELKAPEGWRAVPARDGQGMVDYVFKNPQIKGAQVVKAETVLENARRRFADIQAPDYLPKPTIRWDELKEGSVGTVSLTIIQQVSSTEAVVRVEDNPPIWVSGKAVPSKGSKEVYLSDFPARDYSSGRSLTDWTIEVVGSTTYQGENGRAKNVLHARPLDWRKWIEPVRPTVGPRSTNP